MSENNINIVEELLPRYCDGNVSAEEKEKVEIWIRQSEEHYKIAQQIQLIYLASDTIAIMDQVNPDNACDIVHSVVGCLSVGSSYS